MDDNMMVSDTEILVSNAADERADMANESVARMKRNVITCTMYLQNQIFFYPKSDSGSQ